MCGVTVGFGWLQPPAETSEQRRARSHEQQQQYTITRSISALPHPKPLPVLKTALLNLRKRYSISDLPPTRAKKERTACPLMKKVLLTKGDKRNVSATGRTAEGGDRLEGSIGAGAPLESTGRAE